MEAESSLAGQLGLQQVAVVCPEGAAPGMVLEVPNCKFVNEMRFREISAMQNIPKSTESSPTFSYRLPVPVLKYPGDQQFRVKNVRFETKASIPARSMPLSRFRELLHPNTVRLSISDFRNEIPDRKQCPKHYLNCAEGFWGFRAPLGSRVHSRVRLLADTRWGQAGIRLRQRCASPCPG